MPQEERRLEPYTLTRYVHARILQPSASILRACRPPDRDMGACLHAPERHPNPAERPYRACPARTLPVTRVRCRRSRILPSLRHTMTRARWAAGLRKTLQTQARARRKLPKDIPRCCVADAAHTGYHSALFFISIVVSALGCQAACAPLRAETGSTNLRRSTGLQVYR